MAEKPIKKPSDKSTKQELLEAYNAVAGRLEEKRAAELNPERKTEERRSQEAVKVAEAIPADGVERGIGELKASIGQMLAELADKLASETTKFKSLQLAIASKQKEIEELYGIEKSAASLAALIESQNARRQQFETDMASAKEELSQEIETSRAEWDRERKQHEVELRERDAAEKKIREREREESGYAFKRDQQALKDQLTDEKKKLEQEIQARRESGLKDLLEREKVLAVKEAELDSLQSKVAVFPKELETAVAKAVQDATERIKLDAKNREELLRKEFEGQKNVFTTRIESLERALKEQTDQSVKFSRQLETAYQKVQEIAEKAIEGSAQSKAFAELQKVLVDQGRKAGAEKA